MLILTTVRPIGSDDKMAFWQFNWDSAVPVEMHSASKIIFEALDQGNTVQSRKINYRHPNHATVQTIRQMREKVAAE